MDWPIDRKLLAHVRCRQTISGRGAKEGPDGKLHHPRREARLKGKVEISGSKNSSLPIMAACLMAEGKTTLRGVPRLSDIDSMVKLLGDLGCHVYRHEAKESVGDGPALNGPLDITVTEEKKFRGALRDRQDDAGQHLHDGAAAGQAQEGDRFDSRRLQHRRSADRSALRGMVKLGAEYHTQNGYAILEVKGAAEGLPDVSGRRAGADGFGDDQCDVRGGAGRGRDGARWGGVRAGSRDCANLLNKMGAKITGHGTPEIRIEGVEKLTGCEHRVIPDRIECGTFMIAAAITNGELELKNCNMDHLIAVVDRLEEVGVRIERQNGTIYARHSGGSIRWR
jgi:UDP-N-acetylglucosamine 1-carboxyvinyltransferase